MKKITSCAIALLISFSIYAQKSQIKYGDVPMASLTMTRYPLDSSASAVILGDYGSSTLHYTESEGFKLIFERTVRIKILTKEGLDWANFEIPLYSDGSTDEKILSLKAQTTNLEAGKIIETKVKSESIFKDDANDNLRIVKVTFPNVVAGSVLDITYRINSEFFTNLQDWQFQHSIPVVVSEYKVNIPEWFHYERYMQGYVMLAAADQTSQSQSIRFSDSSTPLTYTEHRFRWLAENVPAFKSEPFITTEKDFISKINFELASTSFPNSPIKTYMGTWRDINQSYAESNDFSGQISGNGFLRKTAEEITTSATTEEQKIAAINTYVKNNYGWNGQFRKFPSAALKKVVESKQGSSAELNFLLASLLDKAGIEVKPVLISTRDHGFVRELFPVSTQFNSVVCLAKIGDKQILLDATDTLLPTGVLPARCLNGSGFVISKSGYDWVPLKSLAKTKTFANADFVIDETGSLSGKLSLDKSGYSAQAMRSKYIVKGEADYIKDFSEGRTWQTQKSEFKNVKEIQEPIKELYEMSLDAHADVAGDIIYLNPFILLREESNPFKLEKREYPVNFGSQLEKFYIGKFTIPPGYSVDELPTNKLILLPGNAAKYSYNVAQLANQVTITSVLQINRDIFTQEEYPNLREFYNQVVAKQSEQIVLKKKP